MLRWLPLFLLPTLALAAGLLSAFDGPPLPDGNGVTPAFQGWHQEYEEVGDYGESWFYLLRTDGGGTLVALLSITNLGLRTFDGSVDLDFYDPAGGHHALHREVHRDEIRGARDHHDLWIGPAHAWGGGRVYQLAIELPEARLQLHLDGRLPPTTFGNGALIFDGDPSRLWTTGWNAPRARASGRLEMDGQAWDLAGEAYADHGWATVKLPSFLRDWFTCRVFDPTWTLVLHRQLLTERYGNAEVSFGLLGREQQVVARPRHALLQPTAWATDPQSGRQRPTAFSVRLSANGYQLSGSLRETRLLDAVDPFARLSWALRAAIRTFYADVWLYRALHRYDFQLVTPEGETLQLSGEAYVEANRYQAS